MTPLRQKRANQAIAALHFKLLCPKLKNKYLSPYDIMKIICGQLKLDIEEVISLSRKQEYVYARFIISYYLYEKIGITYTEIGELLNRSHSSIILSIRQYKNLVLTNDRRFLSMLNKCSLIK